MTVREAFTQSEALYDAPFDDEAKRRFLNELERIIYEEVIFTHENAGEYEGAEDSHVLYASGAYEMLYLYWLQAKAAFALHEYDQYVSAMQLFNDYYARFARLYHRTHDSADRHRLTGY